MFAWWYGYSPFECEFDRNDHVRVVECSYSRVLSKIPAPEKLSNNDNFILELVNWILARELTCRPFCADIIERLDRANSHFNAV